MVKIQKKSEVQPIDDAQKVKMVNMGHIIEIMAMEHLPDGDCFGVTKIDKDRYMINDTGEVLEYQHTENRTENVDNLRRTFKQLRYLINYNFHGSDNELAFTITYGRDKKDYNTLRDPETLYKDFELFMKRLRYKYKDIDYINVVEPQGDGVWHCHILLRFNDLKKAYIPNKEVAELWGQGFVTVKAIRKDVDNIGAYLSAYLGDIELTDKNLVDAYKHGDKLIIKEVEVEGKIKKFIKGGRLHYYPTGMRIYRKSQGIKHPPVDWLHFEEVKKIVGSGTPHYSRTIDILDENDEQLNSITYYQYNLKRKK